MNGGVVVESAARGHVVLPWWVGPAREQLLALVREPHPDLSWAQDAPCRIVAAVDDLWYDQGGIDRKHSRARAVCDPCPFRVQCAGQAARDRERFGIWGGMTPTQLRALRRWLTGEVEPEPAEVCDAGHPVAPGARCAVCSKVAAASSQRRRRRQARRLAGGRA